MPKTIAKSPYTVPIARVKREIFFFPFLFHFDANLAHTTD